jgi:hypothetical protein
MNAAVPRTNRLSSSNASAEVALYLPVKSFLERQGYVVRGEVRGCDLVARRGDEAPVIVELKLRFTLSLLLQGIDRLALSPLVYLAVPRPVARTQGMRPDAKPVRKLCRRLGLGLILIGGRGAVEVIEDPVPYRPRQSKRRSTLLLGEFERRRGDLNVGGSNRTPIVTAYRQDALRCVRALAGAGPCGWANCALCLASPPPHRSCNATSTAGSIASVAAPMGSPAPARKRCSVSPTQSPRSTGCPKRLPVDGARRDLATPYLRRHVTASPRPCSFVTGWKDG